MLLLAACSRNPAQVWHTETKSAVSLASVVMTNCKSKSGKRSIGAVVNATFNCKKALSSSLS